MGASHSSSSNHTVAVTEADTALFQECLQQQQATTSNIGSSNNNTNNNTQLQLRDYVVEAILQPGSGRLCKTFRLRHVATQSTAVCKALWFKTSNAASSSSSTSNIILKQQEQELRKLQQLAIQMPHLCVPQAWFIGETRTSLTAIPTPMETTTTTTTSHSVTTTTASTNTSSIATTTTTTDDLNDTTTSSSHKTTTTADDRKSATMTEKGEGGVVASTNTTTTTTASVPTTSTTTTTTTTSMPLGPVLVQPIFLLRSHVYTTLHDRLASRPFLQTTEKLFITFQILQAIHNLHTRNLVHGEITTENIGLTSTGFVVLLDSYLSSNVKAVTVPDDDPTDYLYNFHPHHTSTPGGSGGNKGGGSAQASGRCYLAPERFIQKHSTTTTTTTTTSAAIPDKITPAMDMFSVGCVLVELFLNGERCCDLGQLLEYRNLASSQAVAATAASTGTTTSSSSSSSSSQPIPLSPTIQQKLSKMESSAIRAACRRMLSYHANDRLSAQDYIDRLHAAHLFPSSFQILYKLLVEDHISTRMNMNMNMNMSTHNDDDSTASPPPSSSTSTSTTTTTTTSTSTIMATPDARMVRLAAAYESVVWETMGIRHTPGIEYLDKILSVNNNVKQRLANEENDSPTISTTSINNNNKLSKEEQLFAETEALLRQLDSMDASFLHDDAKIVESTNNKDGNNTTTTTTLRDASTTATTTEHRSALAKSSLLIYLQWILSTVRHVQRPTSKLVGLELIHLLAKSFSSSSSSPAEVDGDEARLQRIVPVVISLLQDVETPVRAAAIIVLTDTLSMIHSFPPSDSQLFGQYIFKRVGTSHLPSDPSLQVRLAFCLCMAKLADCARHFLDISHAVRLYEAVGNAVSTAAAGGGAASSTSGSASTGAVTGGTAAGTGNKKSKDEIQSEAAVAAKKDPSTVFTDDVTRLLDTSYRSTGGASGQNNTNPAIKQMEAPAAGAAAAVTADSCDYFSLTEHAETSVDSSKSQDASLMAACAGRTLMGNAYQTELAALHETVSRWVVHIATDQSQHASLTKRAMLKDLGQLCTFFGLAGTMTFILPQILAFLNDRKDWQLRAALFENLPYVCRMIGRAATEEFVLPCIEIGFVDGEEQVIRHALSCLSQLIQLGLLSRAILLGGGCNSSRTKNNSSSLGTTGVSSLLEKYSVFLIHPSEGIRHGGMEMFATACRATGSPDFFVYIVPIMRPFLRFQPTTKHMTNASEMERCLQPAWTRKRFDQELSKFASSSPATPKSAPTSQASGMWMAVGMRTARDGGIESGAETFTAGGGVGVGADDAAAGTAKVPDDVDDPQLDRVVEYLRMYARHLAQSSAQEQYSSQSSAGSTAPPRTGLSNGIEASIRLAQSIMFPRQDGKGTRNSLPEWYNALREQSEASDSVVSEVCAIRSLSALGKVYGLSIMGPPTEGTKENIVPAVRAQDAEPGRTLLDSADAQLIEAASLGEWSSEAILNPDVVDTSLLVTKLRALEVPALPPRLCDQVVNRPVVMTGNVPAALVDWRPRMNTLIASSSPISGHTAPVVRLAVSLDNSFFVSGSHDGTCAVWEIPQLEDSVGILDSSIVYSGHSDHGPTRINDVAMVEGTHSVASGASNGSVHVWRVDLVSASPKATPASQGSGSGSGRERSRVVGASSVKNIHPGEGEVLAVSNFSSISSSVVVFATQKGVVHGWDLRCAQEPFKLQHGPDLGHLSTMALGNDRQWLVTGTSRGYVALWDIRFQQAAKLYRHSRGAKICRAATSFVPPPQIWGMKVSTAAARPFVFLGTTSNECGMFDIMDGSCRECFRTVSGDGLESTLETQDPPSLLDVAISPRFRNGALSARADHQQQQQQPPNVTPSTSINCMVGSVGGRGQCFLLTGGSDGRVRFWDFASPTRCYIAAGGGMDTASLQSNAFRPSFERVDFDGPATAARRLMICRQPFIPLPSRRRQRLPAMSKSGISNKADHYHTDSIQDLKIIDSKALISCSRDCTVKVWR